MGRLAVQDIGIFVEAVHGLTWLNSLHKLRLTVARVNPNAARRAQKPASLIPRSAIVNQQF
jgi:hypothetical protein